MSLIATVLTKSSVIGACAAKAAEFKSEDTNGPKAVAIRSRLMLIAPLLSAHRGWKNRCNQSTRQLGRGFSHPCFQDLQHASSVQVGFHPCPAGSDVSALWRLGFSPGHWRRSFLPACFFHTSTFLSPFAPSPLRDFFATTRTLTPSGRGSSPLLGVELRFPSRIAFPTSPHSNFQPSCLQPSQSSLRSFRCYAGGLPRCPLPLRAKARFSGFVLR